METKSIWHPFSEFPIEKCWEYIRSGRIRPNFYIVVRTGFFLVPQVIYDYGVRTLLDSGEKLTAENESEDEFYIDEESIESWTYLDDFLSILDA